MSGALVGLSFTYRPPALGESFVRAGTGSFLGWFRDDVRGNFGTTAAVGSYDVHQTQRQPAYYGYLSLAVGMGFRPSSTFRVSAGVDAMAMAALRQPQWDANCSDACRISGGPDGDSWFPSHPLAGRFMMLVSPFVDAGCVF